MTIRLTIRLNEGQRMAAEIGDALQAASEDSPSLPSVAGERVEPGRDAAPDPATLVERALVLIGELYDLEHALGEFHPALYRIPRPAFEAIDDEEKAIRSGSSAHGFFWAKYARTPSGRLVQAFCLEPPAGWVPPARLDALCADCGAVLLRDLGYPADATRCRRCVDAINAGEDA